MILTHGANSIERGGGGNTVNIGGYDYPVVQIGNLCWTAKNLMADVTGSVWYDNTVNDRGKLYPFSSIADIEAILPDGWRVPTSSDAQYLLVNNTPLTLIDESIGGTNETGFSFIYTGYRFANGNFYDYNREGDFLTKAAGGYRVRLLNKQIALIGPDEQTLYAFSVRLCKDAT